MTREEYITTQIDKRRKYAAKTMADVDLIDFYLAHPKDRYEGLNVLRVAYPSVNMPNAQVSDDIINDTNYNTFITNPEKYGFKKVIKEKQPNYNDIDWDKRYSSAEGDVLILGGLPGHTAIRLPQTNSDSVSIRYFWDDGTHDDNRLRNIRTTDRGLDQLIAPKMYRYVGTPQDSARWTSEWQNSNRIQRAPYKEPKDTRYPLYPLVETNAVPYLHYSNYLK